LLDLIPDHWVFGGKRGHNVSYGEMWVRTVFGSILYVLGLDQPARVEGVAWDGCVLDESCDLKPGVFDRSVRPALADRQGWCWRIGVPKRQGAGAREYREFCERAARGEYEQGATFTWPSADILPPEELAQARATLDPKDYAEQFEARWETAGGAIYHAFQREYNVRPCARVEGKPLVVASDFNVDPMCWCLGHRYPDRLEWFDEIFLRNSNTPATLDVLWQRYRDHRGGFEFYGDASGRQRHSSAAASDYQLILGDSRFAAAGRSIHYPDGDPPLRDRFACTNALLCNAAGDRRMFIDPRCKRLILDLESCYYKPGTSEPGTGQDLGHMSDACGYAAWKLFPIRVPPRGQQLVFIQGRYAPEP
jgi:hypothetical protein